MRSDTDTLVTLMQVLALVDMSDDDFRRYDLLVLHIRQHGGTLIDASEATGIAVTYQVLLIAAAGMIANWSDGGEEVALSLPSAVAFDAAVAPDEAPGRELVKHAVDTLHLLAWARVGDEDKRRETGKALLELTRAVLDLGGQQSELAINLSLLSRNILDGFGDPDAGLAQLYAYRLLVLPRRLPFLPNLPPTKFPPPLPPALDENVLLDVCLQFIEQGVLAQSIDLSFSALEMRDDPKAVIQNQARVVIGDEPLDLKIELAFGRDLIEWAFNEAPKAGSEIGANLKLRALLSLLCENRELLEGFQDDDLGYVYQMIYLGVPNAPTTRLGLAMKTESITNVVRCVVGLSTSEVRANGARDHVFGLCRDQLLEYIRRQVAAEA